MQLIHDIWNSFRRMPTWVQIWVGIILVPVNLAALVFWSQPYGEWIAILAVGGMLPNIAIMAIDRGFGKAMALSHVVLWTPLCWLIVYLFYLDVTATLSFPTAYLIFLTALLLIDVVSLVFDIPDSIKWLCGDRQPA